MDMIEEKLDVIPLFSCPIYTIHKPAFLDVTRKVAKKFISKRKKEVDLNPNYPAYMTEAVNYDPEMLDFSNFVAQAGWDILNNQGYAMESLATFFTDMWCQEHHRHSAMEKHIHGNGAVLSGFYFLDVPENSCRVVFHEPKDSKTITNLPEKDMSEVTQASTMINFLPTEGQLIFTNSWLPHSFTKNEAKNPMRFIHFNIGVTQVQCNSPRVEII